MATTEASTILVMDDELFNVQWLMDFLESRGYEVLPTSNADEAIEQTSKEIYRAAILDLNVPISPGVALSLKRDNLLYQKYPGLNVALHARNKGYRDRQVIIYSVHRDLDVTREAAIIGCTYILKGRPAELKEELLRVLSYDPTAD